MSTSNRKSLLLIIALLFATLGMSGETIIIPGADQMFKAYNNDTFVNFLLSGPHLISLFASLIAGKALQYIDKKKMLLLGLILFTIGGTFGVALERAPFMIVMRCLVGLALGFTYVTNMTIITSLYPEENRRSRMIGILNAGMFCVTSLLTAAGGLVAETFGFKAMFNLYSLGLISIIVIFLFVPKSPPEARNSLQPSPKRELSFSVPVSNTTSSKGWKSQLFILSAGYLIFQISYASMTFFNAVYADEQGLGGAAFAGVLTSTIYISALISSLAYGFLYPKLKRNTILISFSFIIIAYTLFIFFPSRSMAIIGCFFLGYANANAFSQVVMRAGMIAPKNVASRAISVVTAVMSVSFFLSTYTVQLLKTIFRVKTFVSVMPIILTVDILLLIVTVIYLWAPKKRASLSA
ncbi:MAG: MFS transporter [Desulfitobacteriia bacterium]